MQDTLKQLLKRYLPLALLRRVQLEVNKVRIGTIDRLRFPEQMIPATGFLVQRDEYPFRLYPVATAHLEARLRQQFENDNYTWTQDEYLLVYEQPCVIEPRYGWALTAQGRLIYPSLGFSRASYLHKPAGAAKTLRGVIVENYPELVSLRDTGEENYYHFYNDVLAKLFFLEEKIGLLPSVPLLVARSLYEKPYFQYFQQHPYLRDRQWIIQDQQYVRSQRTYFCKPLTHTPHYYARALRLAQPIDLAPATAIERRLFITRSPQRQRFIENNAEVAAICQEQGFEMVDFDGLTLPEQIQVMSQARYVVGIHGAGLANIIFRSGRPLGLLEIYPPGTYFPFHYVLMANQLGFQYDGIIAQPGVQAFGGGFRVDPGELRQRLATLLRTEPA